MTFIIWGNEWHRQWVDSPTKVLVLQCTFMDRIDSPYQHYLTLQDIQEEEEFVEQNTKHTRMWLRVRETPLKRYWEDRTKPLQRWFRFVSVGSTPLDNNNKEWHFIMITWYSFLLLVFLNDHDDDDDDFLFVQFSSTFSSFSVLNVQHLHIHVRTTSVLKRMSICSLERW